MVIIIEHVARALPRDDWISRFRYLSRVKKYFCLPGSGRLNVSAGSCHLCNRRIVVQKTLLGISEAARDEGRD